MPLSEKQMQCLAFSWQCFETEPKIDYDKLHKLVGIASAASAREMMRVAKLRLKEEYGGGAGTPKKGAGTPTNATGTPAKVTTSAKKAGTPGSRKRGAGKK